MDATDHKYTAQNMITLHGLRALAVAGQRAAQAAQQGDTAALERWQNVATAITELRSCAARRPVPA